MADYIPRSSLDQPKAQSAQAPAEREKKDAVVSTPATVKKKSLWDRAKEELMSTDKKTIQEYLVMDLIVPTIKQFINDFGNNFTRMIQNSIDDAFFHGQGNHIYNNYYSSYSRNSYDSRSSMRPYYNNQVYANNNYYQGPRPGSGYDYPRLSYADRGDAEAVLFKMRETLSHYPCVTVADYLDFSQYESKSFVNNNYGWSDLSRVSIRDEKIFDNDSGMLVTRYYLDLPRPMEITG